MFTSGYLDGCMSVVQFQFLWHLCFGPTHGCSSMEECGRWHYPHCDGMPCLMFMTCFTVFNQLSNMGNKHKILMKEVWQLHNWATTWFPIHNFNFEIYLLYYFYVANGKRPKCTSLQSRDHTQSIIHEKESSYLLRKYKNTNMEQYYNVV